MEELNTSELGTQQYWDSQYRTELENYQSHGDPGEIWFGENISKRIYNWLRTNKSIAATSKILDVGCGNGMFLVGLHRLGYTNLYGIDYSPSGIELAQKISTDENLSINYSVCNILEQVNIANTFHVIHDKGTYDAICLNANVMQYRASYIKFIRDSLEDDGFFIITSCNFTEEELDQHFKGYFICEHVIPVTQFQFGGKVGNVVTSLVYKKFINK